MDNRRFNVSGETQSGLAETLSLYGTLVNGRRRAWNIPGQIDFVGYRLDPCFGMVLFIYNNNAMIKFPFDEGKYPTNLAAFFYNYLNSPNSVVVDLPPHVSGYDDFASLRSDFSWDRDADHDGSNSVGWRVFCGQWGHINNSDEALAIRPIFNWYGK